ncbi:sphingosine-1-phosphate phosphatase 1 isoform X2 [Rhinatrema bivittatum]|uniref:sphingosine-1-phosphate phosphatase 1 isoform X2 n=1 Tax=Rhinatrema bivittatum TaxID=194408 RepID=UPI00112BD3BA|nr:sphingosine-1-phosphate phosphatase 1 isoform X2 [Rhinatrema bivittatum]
MAQKPAVLRLFNYLQDPNKVARFQRLCGVQGSFSRASEVGGLLSNGNCGNRRRVGEEEERQELRWRGSRSADIGSDAELKADCPMNGLRNGVLLLRPDALQPRQAGDEEPPVSAASDLSLPPQRKSEQEKTKQPKRRNSLTEEAGQDFVINNKFLYYLFSFGTELGNELFYISFFPFWIWNVDAYVGRKLIVIWVLVMYLGQCTKDVIRWPRPSSPPVTKLEVFYNSEYSMPSTHAMSGTAIPLSLLLLTYSRWQYPFVFGLFLAVVWCSLVCFSRIYMGMHSILDVIAGFLYAILIMVVFHPVLELIDNFNLTYKYAPLIIISLHLAMGIFSFTLDTWSTSRGDTAQILGSGAGIACGSHVNYMLGLTDPLPDVLPFMPPVITVTLVGKAMLRFLIGVVILLMVRAVMKKLTIPLACKIFCLPCDDIRRARQRMEEGGGKCHPML